MNLPELDEIEASVLLSTFFCKKKRYKVFLHKNQLVWDHATPPFCPKTVPIDEVISVGHALKRVSTINEENVDINPNSFVVHYVERSDDNCLKYCHIEFIHNDPVQINSWITTVQNILSKLNRPRKLIIFVNPFGGRKNGIDIYRKKCDPLFKIANVDVTLNISQRKNQIRDYILENSIYNFDGIACVGGDGTVSEIFNGLVIRSCRDLNLDKDDVNLELPKPKIPVGIIPGGSTDTIAFCLHGTSDVTTAVLHIILGPQTSMDLVSVYDQHKLLRLYASVLSYGYLGDVLYHSEKYRWLGPRRYEYSGFKTLLANKGYNGELAVLSTNSESLASSRCFENCVECSETRIDSNESSQSSCSAEDLVWKSIKGNFFMISGANVSCSCDRSPNGIAPFCHLGNGKMHLVIVRHTNLWNNIRLLLRLADKTRDIEGFSFVERYEISEFSFRTNSTKSRWNCDGEVQLETEIRAKVRCQLLTVFGRGRPEERDSQKTCKCC